jgi:CRISPR-associated exonuclease Cas4
MTSLTAPLLVAFSAVLVLALLLWWRARVAQRESGLPPGKVVYADTRRWERSQPFFAPRHALAGKPDYLLRQGRATIPVEVKPGRAATRPHDADRFQLAAYCLLLEETTGHSPPYGLLRYREQTFRLPYDRATRRRLLEILAAMRRDLSMDDVPRSHHDPARCRFCSYREDCGQAL